MVLRAAAAGWNIDEIDVPYGRESFAPK